MCSTPAPSNLPRLDEAHSRFVGGYRDLLRVVAEAASEPGWRDDHASLATLLAARYQVAYPTARRWIREGLDLVARPDLDEAFGAGEVSYDQMRAVATLTDPGHEAGALVENIEQWSITDLQREARRATASKLEERDGGVYLKLEHTPDERFLRLYGQLPPDQGAIVMGAIDRVVPSQTPYDQIDRARAMALVDLAAGSGSSGSRGDTTVVYRQRVEDPVAELNTGGFVSRETARRMSCDARIERVLVDGSGKTIGIGRASRNVPPYLYRQLKLRDRTCVFPGCENERWVNAHHIVHWEDGGPTDLDNLVLVCTAHHTFVHERHWKLRGEAGTEMTWIDPQGRPYLPRKERPMVAPKGRRKARVKARAP